MESQGQTLPISQVLAWCRQSLITVALLFLFAMVPLAAGLAPSSLAQQEAESTTRRGQPEQARASSLWLANPDLALPLAADRPGIECGCAKTGNYVQPASKDLRQVKENASPSGKYQVEVTAGVAPGTVSIVIKQDGHTILNWSGTATNWGFSPDDDRFVIHGLYTSRHYVWLYNLDPDPNRQYEDAHEVWASGGVEISSSRIRFSPHGRYLLYAGVTNAGGLFLRVMDAQNGDERYAGDTTSLYSIPAEEGVAGWGFSSDDKDASFVYAYDVAQDRHALFVVNLMTEQDIYESPSSPGDAEWWFSPCGDIFALIDKYNGKIYLYKTLEADSAVGIASATGWDKLTVEDDGHVAHYAGGSTIRVMENTADTPCPDTDPPTWPQGSTLTASDVKPTQFKLCWSKAQDNVGVTAYVIYTDSVELKTTAGTVTSSVVTGLLPATEYHFKVEARDAAGHQSTGGPVLTVTTPSNIPTWPPGSKLVASSIGVNSLTLTWTAAVYPDGVTWYKIYSDTLLLKTVSGSVLSTTLASLLPHTTYTFTAQACYQSDCSTNGPSVRATTAGDMLDLELSDAPDPVQVGSYLSYHARVTNHRPAGVSNVVVTVTLPAQADLFSVTPTRGSCGTGGKTITCTIGALSWEQSATVSIVMQAAQLGKMTANAYAAAQENDPVPENNSASEITLVNNWMVKELEEGGPLDMALDSQGNIHLAYLRDYGNGSELHYATNASGTWAIQSLVQAGGLDTCAIALDAVGNVHIGYVESDRSTFGARLKHLYQAGGSWSSATTLWESGEGFWPLSMVFDQLGNLHFAYMGAWGAARPGPLYHLVLTSTLVVSETIGENLWAYDYAALAVDGQNRLHLSYYFDGLNYITQDISGTWQTPQLVDTVGGQLEGMVTDIVVDSAGVPHISYVGGSLEDHRYATLTSTGWVTRTIDPGGSVSAGNAIALGPNESVHLSYFHRRSRELRYATNTSGAWVTETVHICEEGSDWGFQNLVGVNLAGLPIICSSPIYCVLRQPVPDSDPDGVPDAEERGPSGNDPNYDGNGDGLPDGQQANVASLHTADGEHYATLAAPEGVILADVHSLYDPSPEGAPAEASFPYRFLSFTLLGVNPGGTVSVTLRLPPGEEISSYYKYGPTLDNPDDHWYEFLYDGTTGAVIQDNMITLYFVDGLRGDSDLAANGQVTDPGAPAIPAFAVYLPLVTKNWGTNNQCSPGQTIADPANDVSPAHIDVTSLDTSLNGQTLQATFQMRDVPSQLTFDRTGVPRNSLEYEWSVYVDVDNDPQTGSPWTDDKGAEYALSAMHFVYTPNSPVSKPIPQGVQVNTWRYDSSGWSYLAAATLTADSQSDTMTLVGNIPGITSTSRLFFLTYDYNPGDVAQQDTSSCSVAAGAVLQQESRQ